MRGRRKILSSVPRKISRCIPIDKLLCNNFKNATWTLHKDLGPVVVRGLIAFHLPPSSPGFMPLSPRQLIRTGGVLAARGGPWWRVGERSCSSLILVTGREVWRANAILTFYTSVGQTGHHKPPSVDRWSNYNTGPGEPQAARQRAYWIRPRNRERAEVWGGAAV